MRSVVSASNRSRMETMTGTFQSDKGGTSIPLLSHPGERGILPIYLPTTFRSNFAAKFSMQIVNNAMHIVCVPAGHFRCIHLFQTDGNSNPALIINYFRDEKRRAYGCLQIRSGQKMRLRFL